MEPTVYFPPTPWYKSKLLWVFLLVLILIPAGSWIYVNYFRKSSPPPAPAPAASKNTLEEDNSPIAFNILQNPMVYEWRGSVNGTLVAKDEKSMTIEKDGKKIVLPIDPGPNGIKFYTKESFKVGPIREDTFLTIDKIPIGTKLRGEFWVFPERKNQLYTGSFTVVED